MPTLCFSTYGCPTRKQSPVVVLWRESQSPARALAWPRFAPEWRASNGGNRSCGGEEMALKSLRKRARLRFALLFRVLALGFLIGPLVLYAGSQAQAGTVSASDNFARANGSLGPIGRTWPWAAWLSPTTR